MNENERSLLLATARTQRALILVLTDLQPPDTQRGLFDLLNGLDDALAPFQPTAAEPINLCSENT